MDADDAMAAVIALANGDALWVEMDEDGMKCRETRGV
jgi:hypothetical protein